MAFNLTNCDFIAFFMMVDGGSAEVCGVVRVCMSYECSFVRAPVHRCIVIICGVGLAAPSLHFSIFLACAGAAL